MMRKYGLPLCALLGVMIGVLAFIASARKLPPPRIPFPPPQPPYMHYIAGEGVVEAASENIQIGTPYNEICTDVYVVAGDFVKEGAPLFKLNVETLEAELYQAEMDRDYAIVEYENQRTQLSLYESVTDIRAVSENEYNQVYYAAEAAQVAIAQADARILTAQTFIDRSTIRAPVDGKFYRWRSAPENQPTSTHTATCLWSHSDRSVLPICESISTKMMRGVIKQARAPRHLSEATARFVLR